MHACARIARRQFADRLAGPAAGVEDGRTARASRNRGADAIRAPTSRCSAAAASYVAAARANARRTARGSTSRGSGAGKRGSAGRRTKRSSAARNGAGCDKKRRVRGACDFRIARARDGIARASACAAAAARACRGRRRRPASAARSWRDRRADPRSRARRARGERRRRRFAAREQAARAAPRACARPSLAALHLQRQEALQRKRYATRSSSPKRASVSVAIACGQSAAGDEARRRADEHQRRDALRRVERPAQRDQAAERPAEHGRAAAPRAANATSTRRDDRVERARRDRRAAPVPGRSTAWTRCCRASAARKRSPTARMHRPAVQQHERRAVSCGLRRADRRSRSRDPPTQRREQRRDIVHRVRGRQRNAQPRRACRHGRRADRGHPEAALAQRHRRPPARARCRRRSAAGSPSPTASSVHGRPRAPSRNCAISSVRCARRARVVAHDAQAPRASAAASSGGAAVV